MIDLAKYCRRIGGSLSVLLICLSFSAKASSEIAPLPKQLHSSILCESMLWTRSQHQGAAAVKELSAFLSAFVEHVPLAPKLSVLGSYSLVVSDPKNMTAEQMESFHKISVPLMEDINLASSTIPNIQTVIVAYRGQEEVQAAYSEFRAELARGVENIESRSKEAFAKNSESPLRIFLTRVLKVGVFMGAMAGLDHIETSTAVALTSSVVAGVYGLEAVLRKLWRGLLTSNFREHLVAIESSLQSQTPVYTAANSRPLTLPTAVHRNFMALGEEQLHEENIEKLILKDSNVYLPLGAKNLEQRYRKELTKGAKGFRETRDILIEKEMRERLAEPTGTSRIVTMNSYFYWDDKTHEPVWVLAYVSHAPRMGTGRKTKKREEQQTDRAWDFGLSPGTRR